MKRSPDGSSDGHSPIVPVAIGAGVGGILIGLLAGAFGILVFRRWRSSRKRNKHWGNQNRSSVLSSDSARSPREMTVTGGGGREFIVEPFDVTPTSSPRNPGVSPPPGGNTTTSPANETVSGSSDPMGQAGRRTNVYVVHHDGGRAPVSVYTEEGVAVVELPPQYAPGSTGSPSEGDASESREADRRKEPGTSPRKKPELRSFVTNG